MKVVVKVLTDDCPFPELKTDAAVITAVLFKSVRPERVPEQSVLGVSWTRLWDAAEKCWNEKPDDRPKSTELLRLLGNRD